MSLARRNEYLRALGIEIWIPRVSQVDVGETASLHSSLAVETDKPQVSDVFASGLAERIIIGPGTSDTLFLVGQSEDAATAIAADIARSLNCEPVWSWPTEKESVAGMSLQQAIQERLFTRVLVFGSGLTQPAKGSTERVIGSAHVIHADSIPVMIVNGAARRALWSQLSTNKWCSDET